MPGNTDSASSSANYQRSVIIWTFSAVGILATLYGAYYLIRHIRYKRAFKEGNRGIAESGQNLFSIDGEGTAVHVDDVREEARPRPFLGGVGSEAARTSVPVGMATDDVGSTTTTRLSSFGNPASVQLSAAPLANPMLPDYNLDFQHGNIPNHSQAMQMPPCIPCPPHVLTE